MTIISTIVCTMALATCSVAFYIACVIVKHSHELPPELPPISVQDAVARANSKEEIDEILIEYEKRQYAG